MNNSVIGLGIAKNIFHLYTFVEGKAVKKKLKRAELLAFFANYPVSLIGIEACGSAHHWARELIKLGHEVILLNARYVKSFVVGNKNDFNDAAGRIIRVRVEYFPFHFIKMYSSLLYIIINFTLTPII